MDILFWLIVAAAIGSALIAGFFYACSILLMPSLARRPDAEGSATMQTVNVVVLNPAFLIPFMGTAVLGIVLSVLAVTRRDADTGLIVLGSLAYVVGCFGVTMVFNVPLNNRLARADAQAPETAALWRHYLVVWTRWNDVRTVASALAAVLLVMALL